MTIPSPFMTPERAGFRDNLDRFFADRVRPNIETWEAAGRVPQHIHEDLGALGVFGFGVPEAYGGLGFDDPFLRCDYAERAFGCGASGVAAAVGGRVISIGPMVQFAPEPFKRLILPEIVAGRIGSALAITEPGGGSDVAALSTRADRRGDGWVLNGCKTFITGGMEADWFVVGARTGKPGLAGISLFLVPAGVPGFSRSSIGDKMGWLCSDQATLYFEDCTLPEDALIGPENKGFLAIMGNFNYERLSMTAGCLGMMRLCYASALGWARERRTFGRRLIEHQAIAHKFAEISARIDLTEAYLERICWDISQGRMPVAEISKAKVQATKALEYVASEAMQIFGGAAYLRGNPVERVWREIKVMAIGGGSEEILRDLAVRQMGLAEA
ncbi:acyl-CoA dehydrogenase family protein [Pseudodonghicola flavimaris]|uniref:Acyl-CoA dehydrogenase family protein n=1 Tax=Pseudodonghicola flavimaris TaxID=3050036 RepID=A0ABT7F6D0_9RHOB|nr:acyl-CoA dehydrogenase family protein [Pseudodonghicola flavimaris]MDK3020164.1 acyl-CoA dehydrogenase family protein [Pseudodonghicola flavimaris]